MAKFPSNNAKDPPSQSIENEWPSPNKKNTSEKNLTGKLEAMGREKELELRRENLESEFLDLHCRAGHTSFSKLHKQWPDKVPSPKDLPRSPYQSVLRVCMAKQLRGDEEINQQR